MVKFDTGFHSVESHTNELNIRAVLVSKRKVFKTVIRPYRMFNKTGGSPISILKS